MTNNDLLLDKVTYQMNATNLACMRQIVSLLGGDVSPPSDTVPAVIFVQMKMQSMLSLDIWSLQVVDDILDITQTTEELGKTAGKDLTSDKTTYPALLGLERSKEVAKELVKDAKDALAMYDEVKAAPLIGLADYILSRTN